MRCLLNLRLLIQFLLIREFGDVFPTDLPGLPSERDIDIAIYLESGTKLISIPLYRMAPAKLWEFNIHLEDLLG